MKKANHARIKCGAGADGPSKFLIDFMSKTNFIAPKNWEGIRELRSDGATAG